MKRIFLRLLGVVVLTGAVFSVSAQDGLAECTAESPRHDSRDSYDPLSPQLFAADAANNVYAAINAVDNTVDLMRPSGDSLKRYASVLVDVIRKRHDTHRIYRPKSVAIYEGYALFLAANRDSGYLAILNFDGSIVNKLQFAGSANAFSYSYEARRLYIAGDKATGYDFISLDASGGIATVSLDKAAVLHYNKPKMSEVIGIKDPLGIGMAVVAMSVVFLSLLLLFLVFKNMGKVLVARQKRRHAEQTFTTATVLPGDVSGAVYAAISAAIHLYNEELHDEETTVLTINKVSRSYSPWNSKIHGINTYFNRR
ncbi:MAG: OadG family protein [Bacteroidales bacterium]|jgi:Na+-transporting methylmalonyl-CoA/oxaloacetate decarboxylase gamma subunit|nr:OadG family protein [Bacteroidales bacterium]